MVSDLIHEVPRSLMKNRFVFTMGIITALLLLIQSAYSQAPSSILGDGLLIGVTSGTPPLASYGYFIFLPANSGNTYQLIGIYAVADGSGTYSYATTSATTAQMNLYSPASGYGVATIGFTTATSGSFYYASTTYPGLNQTGNFVAATNTTPGSITGKTFRCTVSDGRSPFASTGSFTFSAAASGNTFTVIGSGGIANSSGTYTYSPVNRSTAQLQINDSVTGVSTLYVGFSTLSAGGYATKSPSTGGFQIGSFVELDTTPPTASITSPTANQTYSTAAVTVNLAGTAGDDVGVTLVTWSNSRGGSGTASGTTSWNANDIPLQSGVNVITVTAFDAANNTGIDTLTVTNLTRIVGVTGNLSFGNVPVGGSSNGAMTITNSGNSSLTVSSITYPTGFTGNWSGTIPSKTSQNVSVTFSPTSAIAYSGSLSVNSDATAGDNSLSVSGVGTLPVLFSASQSNKLILSWPTNAVGYTLVYATNLPATSWATSSPSPLIVNGDYTVTNTMSGSSKYYRLKR